MKSVLSAALLALTCLAVVGAGPTPAQRDTGTATNALALWQESEQLFDGGRYTECLATCATLVALLDGVPAEITGTAGIGSLPDALLRKAACLLALGEKEKAFDQYEEVENYFPQHKPRAALGAALVYREDKDRQKFGRLLSLVWKKCTRSAEAAAAWHMYDWEVRKGYVWPDYAKAGKSETTGRPLDMFDYLYQAAFTEIAPPGHYDGDAASMDRHARDQTAWFGRSMWEFCSKSPGTFETYWDKTAARADEMSNRFRNLLKEKPDSANRDQILAAIGMLEKVTDESKKPNQVPEDTAHKRADPQH